MGIAIKDKYRDVNYVSTTQTAANIDSFGKELSDLYSGNIFLICNSVGIGKSFLAYKITEDRIIVSGIYAESLIDGGKNALISSLVDCLTNVGASLKVPIEINLDDDSRSYIEFANDLYRERNVEEVYRWKIQE